MQKIVYAFDAIGAWVIQFLTGLGSCIYFIGRTIKTAMKTHLKVHELFVQMRRIGIDSSSIIFLSSLSSGFALALQTYAGLSRIGSEEMLGVVVAWGMTRELGPVLTALMVAGRSGSAIAAEIGTMKISEQIDALRTLRINTFQYLIIPRILAGTLIMPFLTMLAMFFGILGGYLYTRTNLLMNPDSYVANIRSYLMLGDIMGGLIKSSFFGCILTTVGCYQGLYASGGARGVGYATTKSVVLGCILVLIANYFLSTLLFKAGL